MRRRRSVDAKPEGFSVKISFFARLPELRKPSPPVAPAGVRLRRQAFRPPRRQHRRERNARQTTSPKRPLRTRQTDTRLFAQQQHLPSEPIAFSPILYLSKLVSSHKYSKDECCPWGLPFEILT